MMYFSYSCVWFCWVDNVMPHFKYVCRSRYCRVQPYPPAWWTWSCNNMLIHQLVIAGPTGGLGVYTVCVCFCSCISFLCLSNFGPQMYVLDVSKYRDVPEVLVSVLYYLLWSKLDILSPELLCLLSLLTWNYILLALINVGFQPVTVGHSWCFLLVAKNI